MANLQIPRARRTAQECRGSFRADIAPSRAQNERSSRAESIHLAIRGCFDDSGLMRGLVLTRGETLYKPVYRLWIKLLLHLVYQREAVFQKVRHYRLRLGIITLAATHICQSVKPTHEQPELQCTITFRGFDRGTDVLIESSDELLQIRGDGFESRSMRV